MSINWFSIACLTNLSLVAGCLFLFKASRNYSRQLSTLVSGDLWQHPALATLKHKVEMLVDTLDSRAMQLIPVERKADPVEQADSEQTIAALFQEVADDCHRAFNSQISLSNFELFTKSIYRLQHELGLTDEDMANVLAETAARIKGVTLLGKTVDKIEFVKAGDRVDEKWMWPLSYGLRVKQPYGLVLKTESGDVMSKAKVTCI